MNWLLKKISLVVLCVGICPAIVSASARTAKDRTAQDKADYARGRYIEGSRLLQANKDKYTPAQLKLAIEEVKASKASMTKHERLALQGPSLTEKVGSYMPSFGWKSGAALCVAGLALWQAFKNRRQLREIWNGSASTTDFAKKCLVATWQGIKTKAYNLLWANNEDNNLNDHNNLDLNNSAVYQAAVLAEAARIRAAQNAQQARLRPGRRRPGSR